MLRCQILFYALFFLSAVAILLGCFNGLRPPRVKIFQAPSAEERLPKPLSRALKTQLGYGETGESDIKSVRDIEIKRVRPRSRANPKWGRRVPPQFYSFTDSLAGGKNPLLWGINFTKVQLNYELQTTADLQDKSTFAKLYKKKFHPKDSLPVPSTIDPDRYKVGDVIPNVQARHVLIATTWRSGSSFLGDLLNHYPQTFYSFEPLHYLSQLHRNDSFDQKTYALPFLSSLFKCQYTFDPGYLMHVTKPKNNFLFKHNYRYWNSCSKILPGFAECFYPKYIQSVCPLYPIRLIKTVRYRVNMTEPLIQDPDLNLKVIFLVRDPRGVLNSRKSKEWCLKPQCIDPATACSDILSDVQAAHELKARYPDRIHLVRYEDLSLDPYSETDRIIQFLGLPPNKAIENYLDKHTQSSRKRLVKDKKSNKMVQRVNPYDTYRDSKSHAFEWRTKISYPYLTTVQDGCMDLMKRVGYKPVNTPEELTDEEFELMSSEADPIWTAGEGSRKD